jgi:hypothetical protein
MTKKDRIAIVITVIYSLLPIRAVVEGEDGILFVLVIPVLLYWGYRFIKNDISFIGNNDGQS